MREASMPEDGSGKKVFSYDEAVALLPEVRRLTDTAHRQVTDLGAGTSGGMATAQTQGRIEGIIGGGLVTLFAVGALFEALENPGELRGRVDNAFRRPPKDPKAPGPEHYYKPYWQAPKTP